MTTKTQELVREALDLGLEAAELRLAAAKEAYRGYSSRWRSEEAAVDAVKAGIAAYRATSEPAESVARDADRLDWEWLQRQDFEELVICMLIDCPGDGNYFVGGDTQQGEGKTLKEAVRAARLAEKGRPASDESPT